MHTLKMATANTNITIPAMEIPAMDPVERAVRWASVHVYRCAKVTSIVII